MQWQRKNKQHSEDNPFDTGQTCVQRSTRTYFAERATTQMPAYLQKTDLTKREG